VVTDKNESETYNLEKLTEFGAAIRSAREAHGKSLENVSAILRIRQAYLAAMEDGRFEDLPGPTYAAGFVKAYSDYLGLDTEEVMQRYRESMLNRPSMNTVAPPMPVVEGRLPTGFILLISGFVAVLAYGGWYYLTLRAGDANFARVGVPKDISKELHKKRGQTEITESNALENRKEANVNLSKGNTNDKKLSLQNKSQIKVKNSLNGVPSSPSHDGLDRKNVFESSNKQIATPEKRKALAIRKSGMATGSIGQVSMRVTLRANAATWVELRRSNGDRLISQILTIGETFNVPRERGIRLTTGNAGGIDILVDGQLLSPLGPLGAVRRDVVLDPDRLRKRLDRP